MRKTLSLLLPLAITIILVNTVTPFTTTVDMWAGQATSINIHSATAPLAETNGLKQRGPIRIIGDKGFTRENGVVAGSGTADDPYIIEGWEINAAGSIYGIYIRDTTAYFIIRNCKIYGAIRDGVHLENVTNGKIVNSNITNNFAGIFLDSSSNNVIEYNNIADNYEGVHFLDSSNNVIAGNNFINNFIQVYSHYSNNTWDLGYPTGGNYWSDHTCRDQYRGPSQNEPGSDGICDKPYHFDRYPLAEPVNIVTPIPPVGLWGYYNGSVVLVWHFPPSSNVLEYRVYRGSLQNPTFIGSVRADSRDYYVFVDRDITPGEHYCYMVVSANNYGESRPISNCVYTSRYIAVDFNNVNIASGSSYRLTVKINGGVDYDEVYIIPTGGAVSIHEFVKQKNNYYEVTYYSPVTIEPFNDSLYIILIDKNEVLVDALSLSIYVRPLNIGFVKNYALWNHSRDTYGFPNTGVKEAGGVCYGMSETEVLYFMRYILGNDSYPKYPSNYPYPEASTTRDLYVNTTEFSAGILNNVSFAILLHQIFQLKGIDKLSMMLGLIDLGEEFYKLVNYIRKGEPAILVLGPNYPHAVVAWMVSKGNDGYYYIFISDPNIPDRITIARYDLQNEKFYYSAYYYWEKFEVFEAKPKKFDDFLEWRENHLENNGKAEKAFGNYTYVISKGNISIKLRNDRSKVAYFEVIGDSQSFRSSIPGVAGVSENDFVAFAIPKNYTYVIDPGSDASILMLWLDNSSGVPTVNSYLFNVSAPGGFEITPGVDGFEVLATNGSLTLSLSISRALENTTLIFNAYNITLENSTRAVFTIDWSKLSEATPYIEVKVYNATNGEVISSTRIYNQSTAKPETQPYKPATAGEIKSPTSMQLTTLIAIIVTVAVVATAIATWLMRSRRVSS